MQQIMGVIFIVMSYFFAIAVGVITEQWKNDKSKGSGIFVGLIVVLLCSIAGESFTRW